MERVHKKRRWNCHQKKSEEDAPDARHGEERFSRQLPGENDMHRHINQNDTRVIFDI
jgi:hypothetical protein